MKTEPAVTAFEINRSVGNADRAALPDPRSVSFHRTMPGYEPTRLVPLAQPAAELRIHSLVCKDEARRLGLDSFKILGSSWAIHQRAKRVAGLAPEALVPFDGLPEIVRSERPTLCTASDGNHGHAVAALAERLGLACLVLLPAETIDARVAAVERHGADTQLMRGSYDEAVLEARHRSLAEGYWYCPDTARPDASADELIFARDVTDGYSTIWNELVGQWAEPADVVFIQAGVGSFAASAVGALAWSGTRIVTVEPTESACVLRSIKADAPTTVGDSYTVMAGLRCQSVSAVAWPLLRAGVTAAIAIDDAASEEALGLLSAAGVVSGASGAAGLAGVLAAARDPSVREALGLSEATRVAVVNTEGATDPTCEDGPWAPSGGGAGQPKGLGSSSLSSTEVPRA